MTASSSAATCPDVTTAAPPPGFNAYYGQYATIGGLPIVASNAVSRAAFSSVYFTLAHMLATRPCEHEALVRLGIRVVILGRSEQTLDIPEVSDLDTAFPGVDWNTRARALGPSWMRPVVIAAEENLLNEPQDPWFGENILIHEFGHGYWEFGVQSLSTGAANQMALTNAFDAALTAGLWANTYAGSDHREYLAEGVQDWFDNNLEANPPDGIHNQVNTRAELQAYDPTLAGLLERTFTSARFPPWCTLPGTPAWVDPLPAQRDVSSCTFAVGPPVQLGCADATPSPGSSTEVRVNIANRSFTRTYRLEWINFDGMAMPYGTIGPRQEFPQQTYAGHVWRLVDENGVCVQRFAASAPDTRVAVE